MHKFPKKISKKGHVDCQQDGRFGSTYHWDEKKPFFNGMKKMGLPGVFFTPTYRKYLTPLAHLEGHFACSFTIALKPHGSTVPRFPPVLGIRPRKFAEGFSKAVCTWSVEIQQLYRFLIQKQYMKHGTPWKINGWNLRTSPMRRKENDRNQTSMIMCKMLIFRGVSWKKGTFRLQRCKKLRYPVWNLYL